MSIAFESIGASRSRLDYLSPRVSRPMAKVAFSSVFLATAMGGTTSGVPFREPVLTVREIEVAPSVFGQKPSANADLVQRLKLDSGLTWDQIAKTFDVSRRAVHLWVGGGRINSTNLQAIHAFRALVAQADGRTPEETRRALLTVGLDGFSPLDRFRRTRHDSGFSVTGTPFDPLTLLGSAGSEG